MNHRELRRTFLEFYAQRGHKIVPSSSLIPSNDPTLLFTSAGMVQFKPFWAGTVELPYKRACSIQKCLRASDLERVGKTPRHCTFFEMLGNFSFGDYFKAEAIPWAWEYLTDVVKLDPSRLYVSVFEEDEEAYRVWHKIVGLPESKIYRLGAENNFWGPAGETGACGPCSEIYYDLGPEFSCGKETCAPGCDCDRFSELYNIVFPQFNQMADGTRVPLKNRGIDTGMGLERLAMASQGKKSIFESDLFAPIVKSAKEMSEMDLTAENRTMFYIACDHARALTFAIADGVIPSNEGRGYILRSILRRALIFAYRQGIKEPFLYKVSAGVVELMRQFYPELVGKREQTALIIKSEEERFLRTLTAGLERWGWVLEKYEGEGEIPGEELFKLHDTYGFHIELVEELAKDAGVRLDLAGFEKAMGEQKERSRKASFVSLGATTQKSETPVVVEFVGYSQDELETELLSFTPQEDGSYEILLRETPFYAEAGGQVGDTGKVIGDGFEFEVIDSYYKYGVRLSRAKLKWGSPKSGRVFAQIDKRRRREIERAHTATHLLHAALRRYFGDYVKQAGSLVEPGRLRFDFTAFEPLKEEERTKVEELVYEQIIEDLPVECLTDVSLAEAKQMGALAFFEEEYGERVRVVRIGDFSMELCGGTHLRRTGEIGFFRIVAEAGVAAGIRRIEAVVGKEAFLRVACQRQTIDQLQQSLGVSEDLLLNRVEGLSDEVKRLENRLRQLSGQLARQEALKLWEKAERVSGVKLIIEHFPHFQIDELRMVVDHFREIATGEYLGLLSGGVSGERLRYVVFVSPGLEEKLSANGLAKVVGQALGGGGGGRVNLAEGGGAVDRLNAGREAFQKAVATALGDQSD